MDTGIVGLGPSNPQIMMPQCHRLRHHSFVCTQVTPAIRPIGPTKSQGCRLMHANAIRGSVLETPNNRRAISDPLIDGGI